MRQLSFAGQHIVNDIAQRHGFSVDATLSMLDSIIDGNGTMAQFSHPEFAGPGQWMQGGMTMVSDMFNNGLKARVDSLCSELSKVLTTQPELVRRGSFQSQRQNNGYDNGQKQVSHGSGLQHNGSTGNFSPSSLFVPPAPGTSGEWWPAGLCWPNSTGAQNGVRFAYFAPACRLVIEVNGGVTVYDTLDHDIRGFSQQQQQSDGGTVSFNSQYGLLDVASLPVISVHGPDPFLAESNVSVEQPRQSENNDDSRGAPPGNKRDLLATIEKLADLHVRGILSDDEFTSKKAELLRRL